MTKRIVGSSGFGLLLYFAIALTGNAFAQSMVTAAAMADRMTVCTACHGKEGRAAPDGFYPRIAGKSADYLFAQLKNFQAKRRSYEPMTHLVRNLSDMYLREIADYFSALDLPYPAPLPANASAVEMLRGEQLVKRGDKALNIPACNSCHGDNMTGMLPGTPGLLGLPRDYINSQIGAWKEGSRTGSPPDCMRKVSKELSPADLSAVAGWLSAQPVPARGKPSPNKPLPFTESCQW
jgi:cytochrome c553